MGGKGICMGLTERKHRRCHLLSAHKEIHLQVTTETQKVKKKRLGGERLENKPLID
jgi:hypothetical protein